MTLIPFAYRILIIFLFKMADHMPEILAASFHSLQLELRAGHLGSKILDFSGDSYRRFNAWLRDIKTKSRG